MLHWCVELGPGVSDYRALGPEVVSLLMDAAGSQGLWLQGPRYPKAGVGMVVGKGRAWGIPRLMPACRWVGCVLPQQAVGLWQSWG